LGALSGRDKRVKVRAFRMNYLSERGGGGGGIALPGMVEHRIRRGSRKYAAEAGVLFAASVSSILLKPF